MSTPSAGSTDSAAAATQLNALKELLKKTDVLEDKDRVLESLREIRALAATRELLAQTKIGVVVKRLSEDETSSAEVKRLASDMVADWKANKFGLPAPGSTPASTPSPPPEEPLAKRVKLEAGAAAVVSVTLPTDPKRARMCKLFEQVFQGDAELFETETRTQKCVELEEAMFASTKGADEPYGAKYRSLKFNLGQNEELRMQFLEGDLPSKDLVEMSAEQLLSSADKERLRKGVNAIGESKRSDWFDANIDQINKIAGVESTGGMFVCGKCKSDKTSHYQKQTRSADEPMTVFVKCLNCGKRWRC